jgi:hypothetical protein
MKWLFDTPNGSADCAVGHQGQFMCTWPDSDLVVAITSEETSDYTSSCRLLDLISEGLDFDSQTAEAGDAPPNVFLYSLLSFFVLLCVLP